MTEVVEFLKARLDEDFELARNAMHEDASVSPGEWITEHHDSEFHEHPDRCHIAEDRKGVYWTVASEVSIPNAEHMARHDPARVLREIAAKRAMIADWEIYADAEYPDFEGGFSSAMDGVVDELARVYWDHPEFKSEWA